MATDFANFEKIRKKSLIAVTERFRLAKELVKSIVAKQPVLLYEK